MRRGKITTTVILSIMMGATVLAGCENSSQGTKSTAAVSDKAESSDSIYGIVESVDEDSVVIKVGTVKEPEQNQNSQETQGDQETEDSQKSQGDQDTKETQESQKEQNNNDNKLDLTGEEKDITVTDSTKITEEQGMPGGPQGQNGPGNGQQPPEKPDDQNSQNGQTDQQQPPEKPDEQNSQNGQQQPPEKPDDQNNQPPQMQEAKEIALSDLEEGDLVEISLDESGNAESITVKNDIGPGGMQGAPGQGGGQTQAPSEYSALTTYDKDTETKNETYESTGKDENAVLVENGAKVTLDGASVSRTSDESTGGDGSSFYGTGAAVLTTEGETNVKNSTISTDASGGTGIFSYNKGVTYVADTKISTEKDTSGALHVAGGGTLYAWNVTAETKGQSSAAIRSDRGGGTMVVDGGSYTSNGTGSPAVYSTADITVHNADLKANGSEAVCIEGKNSLRLFDTNLTGNMSDDKQNDCTWNVILYQSMSGDSEEGNSTFEMSGGTLTARNGGMFYTTNTESTFVLNHVDINYAKENDFFLRCTGNSNQRGWGSSGSNGADCNFTAISQDMQGDIIWDSISKLDFYMTKGSTLCGAITDDESDAGNGGDGYCNLYIEKDSTWTVTGDSTLTSLQNEGKIVDADGKTVTIKGTDGKVLVKGDSQYTVTVGEYKDKVDTSGATKSTNWEKYQVDKSDALG